MPNYENFFVFEFWQYEVIRHAFTFTVAVFAAALVYFVMSARDSAPQFRTTSYISAVVMVSATIELAHIFVMWDRAFDYDAANHTFSRVEGAVFANGYRYANWLIDVPMLLTQFLVVLGFAGAAFFARWWKLTVSGVVMIILGYIGQYHEPQVAGFLEGPRAPFWIWGGLSWLVFFYLLYVANEAMNTGLDQIEEEARGPMRNAWHLLLVTWFTYGFVYLVPGIPVIGQSETWVVVRQLAYSFADVASKAIFGILLVRVALIRTRHLQGGDESGSTARSAA
jgi:bacteriorhodopsin